MGARQAGMLAAIFLVPSCGSDPRPGPPNPMEPLRRATFRTLAARDFLASCPAGPERHEVELQVRRFEELKQLALRKRAGRAIWLGENDWAGVARYSDREPCAAGEEEFGQALAAFSGSLDSLAGQIAAFRN